MTPREADPARDVDDNPATSERMFGRAHSPQFAHLHAVLADTIGAAHTRAHLEASTAGTIRDLVEHGQADVVATWVQRAYDCGLDQGRQVERNAQQAEQVRRDTSPR